MIDYRLKMRELLAIEYNCRVSDFLGEENMLTESVLIDGRRRYSDEKYFFHMATTGANAVVTADEYLHPFLAEFIKGKRGHTLFEIPSLIILEKELNKYSYKLTPTYHMFLPVNTVGALKSCGLELEWYYDGDIHRFYGDERFPNAICEKYLPNRPDRIAVVALSQGEIVGMAGCSEDTHGWMQIGIDVLPEFRSKGLGTYLVDALKNKIEEMGAVPFYGTSISNYHSWNIAINCGFRPAWVEIGADKMGDAEG